MRHREKGGAGAANSKTKDSKAKMKTNKLRKSKWGTHSCSCAEVKTSANAEAVGKWLPSSLISHPPPLRTPTRREGERPIKRLWLACCRIGWLHRAGERRPPVIGLQSAVIEGPEMWTWNIYKTTNNNKKKSRISPQAAPKQHERRQTLWIERKNKKSIESNKKRENKNKIKVNKSISVFLF